jgi:hypothetical protein
MRWKLSLAHYGSGCRIAITTRNLTPQLLKALQPRGRRAIRADAGLHRYQHRHQHHQHLRQRPRRHSHQRPGESVSLACSRRCNSAKLGSFRLPGRAQRVDGWVAVALQVGGRWRGSPRLVGEGCGRPPLLMTPATPGACRCATACKARHLRQRLENNSTALQAAGLAHSSTVAEPDIAAGPVRSTAVHSLQELQSPVHSIAAGAAEPGAQHSCRSYTAVPLTRVWACRQMVLLRRVLHAAGPTALLSCAGCRSHPVAALGGASAEVRR